MVELLPFGHRACKNGTDSVSLSCSLEHCTREEPPLLRQLFDGMDRDKDLDSEQLHPKLLEITADIRSLAKNYEGDNIALLAILRALEKVHGDIRDELFQASLPDTRQKLYDFLKDIEEKGGWPYIERMNLISVLNKLPESARSKQDISDDH
ncbi:MULTISPECIES: hypothetical protein [unclassified Moorena]|nr:MULTISPECIES: hypothetical protein [unclassified Moorena]